MPKLDVYRSQARQQRANDNQQDPHHLRLDRLFDNFDLGIDLSDRCATENRSTEPDNETRRIEIMPAA